MQTTKALSLYHIIRPADTSIVPPTGKPAVLFLFHGYGSDENDLFSFAQELPKSLCIISIRAPYPMQPSGNAWYAIYFDAANGKFSDDVQAIESRDRIVNFIDEAIEAYSLDSKNVSLLGFSQGTILSYAVALSYPEKIKNVIALSGYINEGILKEGYEKNNFDKIDWYCSHGSMDQVIPIDWARKAPELLKTLSIQTKLHEFPTGHGVPLENFKQFKAWITQRL